MSQATSAPDLLVQRDDGSLTLANIVLREQSLEQLEVR
jgi:hypothetical protein